MFRDRKNYFRKSEGNQNIERARSACELSARQVSVSPGGVARVQMPRVFRPFSHALPMRT